MVYPVCVEGPDPYVMFLHGEALHRMDLDGGNHRRVASGVGREGSGPGGGVLLDYHYAQHSLFWADRSTGVLYRAGLSGSPRQVCYIKYNNNNNYYYIVLLCCHHHAHRQLWVLSYTVSVIH